MNTAIQLMTALQIERNKHERVDRWHTEGQINITQETQPQKSTTKISNKKGKKVKKGRGKGKKKTQRRYWTKDEQKAYFDFIRNHIDTLRKPSKLRTSFKINMRMMEAIKTRSRTQCHSHNQKMLEKYDSLEGLYQYISKEFYYSQALNNEIQQSNRLLENELHQATLQNLGDLEFNLQNKLQREINSYLSFYDVSSEWNPFNSE